MTLTFDPRSTIPIHHIPVNTDITPVKEFLFYLSPIQSYKMLKFWGENPLFLKPGILRTPHVIDLRKPLSPTTLARLSYESKNCSIPLLDFPKWMGKTLAGYFTKFNDLGLNYPQQLFEVIEEVTY